jgi:uncharacterized protein (TIGR02118 family)
VIKIVILYPNQPGTHFDLRYYVEKHMPDSIARLSAHPGFRGVSVEGGISGAEPGSQPEYVAMCEYLFNSTQEFLDAFLPHAEILQGDIPNYTNVAPIIQINEILITR